MVSQADLDFDRAAEMVGLAAAESASSPAPVAVDESQLRKVLYVTGEEKQEAVSAGTANADLCF